MHRSTPPSIAFRSCPRLRLLLSCFALLALSSVFATPALAAPPSSNQQGSASGSTSGPSATGRGGPGGSYSTDGKSFVLPDFVYGGNALSFHVPIQFGLTPNGFTPRGRIGLRYDRQLHRAHWLHIGAAAVFDRGNWETFRLEECGLTDEGTCQPGTTAGMDLELGYTHKLFIESKPWIVPTFRGGLAGGFWYYPRIGGTREQTRELSWMLGLQVAAGIRFFLLRELAIGLDIEFRPGFVIHRERAQAATESTNQGAFILPLQIPVTLEYRF